MSPRNSVFRRRPYNGRNTALWATCATSLTRLTCKPRLETARGNARRDGCDGHVWGAWHEREALFLQHRRRKQLARRHALRPNAESAHTPLPRPWTFIVPAPHDLLPLATLNRAMPNHITRNDILARLCALPIDDPLQAASYRMEAMLDQMEAEGLHLMRNPATVTQGSALVTKARRARSGSRHRIVHWMACGPEISPDLAELFARALDDLEGIAD